ncbi:MAG: hypothetical protein J7L88_01585, partial [Thermoplasmata archaeon]|nr:hypothetical protein [Thermoplasmata archaeon]
MKKIVGVIHLPPLPGTPRGGSFMRALEKAISEAQLLADAEFTGLILENYGDKPYPKDKAHPLTVASMTAIALKVREIFPGEVGINILRNCAEDAVSVAEVVGADFV